MLHNLPRYTSAREFQVINHIPTFKALLRKDKTRQEVYFCLFNKKKIFFSVNTVHDTFEEEYQEKVLSNINLL